MKLRLVILIAVLAALVVSVQAQNATSEMIVTSTEVETHPSQGEIVTIEGSSAMLARNEGGILGHLVTSDLEDGHVYTLWVVMVNNPDACAAVPCTAPEILGQSDELQSEITWGDGIIVGDGGRAEFTAYVPAGEVQEPWMGNGLTNPTGAEVHFIINDHGELIPEMAANMLNSYRGGCTDESLPPPFPDTAKADGEPGPNTCRLIQAAIFHA